MTHIFEQSRSNKLQVRFDPGLKIGDPFFLPLFLSSAFSGLVSLSNIFSSPGQNKMAISTNQVEGKFSKGRRERTLEGHLKWLLCVDVTCEAHGLTFLCMSGTQGLCDSSKTFIRKGLLRFESQSACPKAKTGFFLYNHFSYYGKSRKI